MTTPPTSSRNDQTGGRPDTKPATPAFLGKDSVRWHCLRRLSEVDAEYRIALFRVVAILILLSVHLVFYSRTPKSGDLLTYHQMVFIVALAAASTSMLTIASLWQHFFPRWLPAVFLMADLLCIGCLATGRPGGAGPLLHLFPILIVTAGLRFRLELVWIATIGSLFGYAAVLIVHRAKSLDATPLPERLDQCLHAAMVLLVGLLVGQLVRRVHQLGKIAIDSGVQSIDETTANISGARPEFRSQGDEA